MSELTDQNRDDKAPLEEVVSRAQRALQAKDPCDAVVAVDTIKRRFPQEFRACFDIAVALFELPAMAAAEAVFSDLVDRFPNDIWAAHYSARLAGLRRDWPEAIRRWDLVKSRFPDNAVGYEGEGLALRDAGELDQAESALSAAVAKFPGNFGTRCAHADMAARRWDWQGAVVRWGALTNDFPNASAAHVGLARVLYFSGRFDEAEKVVLDAVERFPDDFYAAYHYAWFASRSQHWVEALARWDRVQTKFPDNPLGSIEFAQTALALERIDLAAEALARSASRFPGHGPLQQLHTILPSLRLFPAVGDMVTNGEAKPIREVERKVIACGSYLAYREGEGNSTLCGGGEELGGNDYIEVEDAMLYNLPGCYGMVELRDGRMYSVGQWGAFYGSIDTIVRRWGQKCYKIESHPLLLKHRPRRLRGRYCMAYRLSSQLYFDFLTETVESVRESLSTWPAVQVLLPGCDGFFTRMPRSVFCDAIARVTDGQDQILWLDEGVFQIDRLILRRKWWYGSFGFVDHILQGLSEQPSRGSDVIYISRTKANTRGIAQERELVQAISEVFHHCETVYLEDLPFAEQVAIFQCAKVVIGAHGGGLANIVFCRAGTQIIEIRPGNSPKMYAHISYMRSLDYKAYIIPKPVHHVKEFRVDVAEFRTFLAAINTT